MTKKQRLQQKTSSLALARLGEPVLINGFSHQAILNDNEFKDETGYLSEVNIEVLPDDVKHYRKNDSVIVGDKSYKVMHIPQQNTDDLLVRIELKRA